MPGGTPMLLEDAGPLAVRRDEGTGRPLIDALPYADPLDTASRATAEALVQEEVRPLPPAKANAPRRAGRGQEVEELKPPSPPPRAGAGQHCERPVPGPAWCLMRLMPELDPAKLARRASRDAAEAPLAPDESPPTPPTRRRAPA